MLKRRSIEVSEALLSEVGEGYLNYLCDQGVVRLSQGVLYVTNPIRLAMETVKLGVDIEIASRWLNWRDFERLCVEALQSHDFKVRAPLRFKFDSKRHEIDIVACKKNAVLCIDCKHWEMMRGQQYKVKKSATSHLDKCIKLAKSASSLRNMGLNVHSGAYLVPIMITLIDLNLKLPLNSVWVIPVFKLNSFLLELEAHIDEISSIRIY
ncbi:MAG: nuclease-related domain-containing protein [Candidatus Nezhaarchaeales archaeon]